jgi:hypothetical protein
MSTIYIILGIIGWTASGIVIALYVWKRRPEPRGFDIGG